MSGGDDYARKVAEAWGPTEPSPLRSFWNSPVVMGEINRRISGDPAVDSVEYFRREFCAEPRQRALSLGSGNGNLELQMLEAGVAEHIHGVDISPSRVAVATSRMRGRLAGRATFSVENLETWEPTERYDLIIARDVLHHLGDLEGWCRRAAGLLEPGGLVYVEEFIGPPRFQWTDTQLDVINRLLDRLPDRLRVDLVETDGRLRAPVGRPDRERFIAADPSEAIDPPAIPGLLAKYLEPVEVKRYGGAVYHQFFNRIMGNFAADDDLVRMIMEFDFILTDLGALEPDYLWGVYRPRAARGWPRRRRSRPPRRAAPRAPRR